MLWFVVWVLLIGAWALIDQRAHTLTLHCVGGEQWEGVSLLRTKQKRDRVLTVWEVVSKVTVVRVKVSHTYTPLYFLTSWITSSNTEVALSTAHPGGPSLPHTIYTTLHSLSPDTQHTRTGHYASTWLL